MPAYVVALLGFFLGILFLALALLVWWIVGSVKLLRDTIEKATVAIGPLLSDPRFNDAGQSLHTLASAAPQLSTQLTSISATMKEFYKMALVNAGGQIAAAVPAGEAAEEQPSKFAGAAPEDTSGFFQPAPAFNDDVAKALDDLERRRAAAGSAVPEKVAPDGVRSEA